MFLSGLFVILLTVGSALLTYSRWKSFVIHMHSKYIFLLWFHVSMSCSFPGLFRWVKSGSWLILFANLGTGMECKQLRTWCLVIKVCTQRLLFLMLISGSSHDGPLRNFLSASNNFWDCCRVGNFLVSWQEGQREESFHSWSNWLHTLLLTSKFCWHSASILHTFIKMFYWAPTLFLGFPIA